MTYQVLLVIQYLSIFILMLESGYIFAKMKTRLQAYLFFYCVATLVNNGGYLLEMLAKNESEYLIALKLSYMGRVWVPYSLFIFTIILCKIKVNRKLLAGLAFGHAFTFFTVLTCEYQTLYYTGMTYVTEGIFPYLKVGHGVWYNIYSFGLYFYIIFGLFHLIKAVLAEKDAVSKKRLFYMTLAIVADCLGYIVYMTGWTGSYDSTMMGYSVGSVFMFIALFRYNLLDTLQLAKDYVVDEMSEAIIAVDSDGFLEYYNQPAKRLFDNLEQECDTIIEVLQAAIASGEPIHMNDRIYSPEVRNLYQEGSYRGKVYVLMDDTEHYIYLKNLQEQKDIAEAANASKSAFVSVVSHELRTPMNAIVGMTELILREPDHLNPKQLKHLRNIKTSGDALVMIVNDILDQSKIEAGKMEIVEDTYEIRPMVEDVAMIIENRIGTKPIRLVCDIDEAIPKYLVGDGLRIRQILINLMNNAVKFTEEGYIRLCIRCTEVETGRKKIGISVKDSGQGIKPEDLDKLGQAFMQVDQKKNHSKGGTGLGLSISRDFIVLMGGQLVVNSEYGKGTEFSFEIWQKDASDTDVASPVGELNQEPEKAEQFTAKQARVLIVDDMDLNLMLTEELLEPMGMMVDTADSGEKAIEMVKGNKYDVVFMDYMMPYMDGVEATTEIRKMALDCDNEQQAQYFRTLPIIVLSGDDAEDTKEKFLCAGVDDFIVKPVEFDRLQKVLLKWLPKELID